MTTKKVLSSAKHSLVVFGLRESIHKTFGKYLASSVLGFQATQAETRFHYMIPPMLCQRKVDHDSENVSSVDTASATAATTTTAKDPESFPPNYLTTSACLAILDDLSSFACMAGDRTHRTGVSLSLSADLIHPSRMTALSEVDVLCKIDKIGRYVGFLTVEFVDRVDGRVLARGTHNKFLPTGFLWETILSKPFFPLGLWLFQKYAGPQRYTTAIDYLFPERQVAPDEAKSLLLTTHRPASLTKALGSVWDLFSLTPTATTTTTTATTAAAAPIASQEDTDNTNTAKGSNVIKYVYATEVTKETKNYVGLMHGGAVGSVIERACLTARQRQWNTQQYPQEPPAVMPPMIIDSMEVRYLSANKGKLTVEVWDDAEASTLSVRNGAQQVSSRSIGVIRDAASGAINVQFICHWRLV